MKSKNNYFFISSSVSLILIAYFIVTDAKKVEVDPNYIELSHADTNKKNCKELFKDTALGEEVVFEYDLFNVAIDKNSKFSETSYLENIKAFKECFNGNKHKLVFNIKDKRELGTKVKLEKISLFMAALKRENIREISDSLIIKTNFNSSET